MTYRSEVLRNRRHGNHRRFPILHRPPGYVPYSRDQSEIIVPSVLITCSTSHVREVFAGIRVQCRLELSS
jgi:hypothetical protein